MNARNANNQQQLTSMPMPTSELIQSASKLENLPAQSVARMQSLVISLQVLEMSRSLAYHFCNTEMVPQQFRGKPEDGAVAIMWGNEIGLDALQSLQNVAVVNGRPTLWGDALTAIVKGSGQCEYLTSTYDEATRTATVTTKRVDEPEEVRSYSWVDAEAAGLSTRDTYKKHPKRMLHARARAHLLNDVYPDLLKGIKVREIEEDGGKRKERDITPRRTVLTDILAKQSRDNLVKKPPESVQPQTQAGSSTTEPVVVTSQKEVEQSQESGYKQDSSANIDEYLIDISTADQDKLTAIGVAIRDDDSLTMDQMEKLREAYTKANEKFKES